MSVNIGNKKYRNLQEQVGFNAEQIEKIFQILDGLSVTDNVIIISDLSDVLTSEELEIVQKAVAFIVYDGQLYIKKSEDTSKAYFDIVFTISASGGVIYFASKEIIVTLSNGALAQTTSTNATYSTSQIDSLVSAKADAVYVDEQLDLKANLSGANFSGAVTAPTLKQSQFNSSQLFNISNSAGLTITNVYNRFAEINNTLHLIVNFIATNSSGVARTIGSGYGDIGFMSLILPSEIGSKIYDIDGKTIAESALASNTLVSSEPAQVLLSKTLNTSTKFYNARLSIANSTSENACIVFVSLNGDNGDRITVNDGESLFVTARMALTLI